MIEGGDYALVLGEDLLELFGGDAAGHGIGEAGQPGVRLVRIIAAHSLEEESDGQLAVLINAHVEDVVGVGLVLQPGAVIGYHSGAISGDLGLVVSALVVVHAGGTDYLRHYYALGAVYDEGAARGS